MDMLTLETRVRNTITLGESHFREFKSALQGAPERKSSRPRTEIRKDIAEALVAFANADGGDILIGVEDDGVITGVPHSAEDQNFLLNTYSELVKNAEPLPIIASTRLQIDQKTVLFFSVNKATTSIFQLSDGRCMRRKDKSTVPCLFSQIHVERQEVRSREWDRQFVDGATTLDLNQDLLQSMANQYLQGLSIELYLQQLGLAEFAPSGLRLRMAALLLFAKDIFRWHPKVQVRILKVNGEKLQSGVNYNVIADETETGNIFELLKTAWERLRPLLTSQNQFTAEAKFDQSYRYPEIAVREALVNAITHRDYSANSPIEVFVFDDRMEIKSPGALLSTLTIESLRALEGVHESRNVLIARVLREHAYVRELGEGVQRIFSLMRDAALQAPILYSNTTYFSITLEHQSVFNSLQISWLSQFSTLNLSPRQKKIVVAGMNGKELSRRDIERALSTKDRDTYDREVTYLRNLKILEQIRSAVTAKQKAMQLSSKEGRNVNPHTIARFRVNPSSN